MDVGQLMDQCLAFFKNKCYTENRISVYKTLWRKGIVPFMKAKRLSAYTAGIGKEFAETCHYNGTVRPQEREKIRSVQVLDDMLLLGKIRKRCFTPVEHRLDGEIGKDMEKLICHLTNMRRSRTTISDYRLYLSEFLMHLYAMGAGHTSEITEKHIIDHISSLRYSRINVISSLNVLFHFWKEEHVIGKDFTPLFHSFSAKRRERVPSFYSREEVQKIEGSISRTSPVSRRNYAMLLLASRLGLRASDIAGLRFCDINWDAGNITLTMRKTGKNINLPLLPEVGNAIIDYLRYGRPESGLNQVFVSSRAPYAGAAKSMVCSAINASIVKSGVDVSLRHHGPHSLRHSLATALMEQGSPLPVISEVLGHRSTETTMVYIKMDVPDMKKCAMPVPPVSEDFYNQRGGAFYE
jgi:site-specific recombinase XerD